MNNEKTELKEIEILRVNTDLIEQEKTNGFKIQKSKLSVFIKKLPSNIYKLVVLFLGAVADRIPNFLSRRHMQNSMYHKLVLMYFMIKYYVHFLV